MSNELSTEFERLLEKVRRCTLCAAHLPLGPRPVVRLAQSVKLLIIAQAPGTKVHASGLPFDDVSGNRLRAWLGLTREEFYDETKVGMMPMGFCYPGKGVGGDNPPRPECAPLWHDQLLKHLTNVELTLIIGKYAIERYLPEQKGKNLGEIVKAWSQDERKFALGAKVGCAHAVPLVHPSPRNQMWIKRNPWFEKEILPKLKTAVKKLKL